MEAVKGHWMEILLENDIAFTEMFFCFSSLRIIILFHSVRSVELLKKKKELKKSKKEKKKERKRKKERKK